MDKIADQARQFLISLANNSEFEFTQRADEILIFLNRISDSRMIFPQFAPYIHSINDIIHGLESDPEHTLRQPDIQKRLYSFFMTLAKSSNK